jgi:hypothetical protein
MCSRTDLQLDTPAPCTCLFELTILQELGMDGCGEEYRKMYCRETCSGWEKPGFDAESAEDAEFAEERDPRHARGDGAWGTRDTVHREATGADFVIAPG